MKLEFEKAKSLIPEIKNELKAAIVQFLQEPKYDYSPVSAARWSRVDTDIKHDVDGPYTAIYFEIGAELDYEGMSELLDELNPIVQKIDPDAYFEPYDPGISTCYIWYEDSEIESCQDITSAELPDYGGAFDIDPHEFFTKEECMELAQEVEDILNKDPDVPYPVQYYDVYIVDYNRIVVDLTDSQDNELSGQAKIDMRRIRVPQDLITKYGPIVADSVKEDIAYIYSDEIESSLDLNSYDDGYVEMRDGEPNFVYNTLRDAQKGVEQSRAGDSEYGMGSHEYKIMKWNNNQLQDIDESEKIQGDADWNLGSTENPMVRDSLWPDESDTYQKADDVKGTAAIEFDDLIEVYDDGEFEFVDDYNSTYKNAEDGSDEWIDEETAVTVIRDSSEAAELTIDIFNDYAYTRFPMKPGQYRISGILEVPYIISDLYEDVIERGDSFDNPDVYGYDEESGEVDFQLEKYVLNNFKTHNA